ncbi:MAG TPA: LacI family DNA-binding transcriptional regulator [Capsulimonadaceae bacterium]|jgi:LacI family transcriptional regulator
MMPLTVVEQSEKPVSVKDIAARCGVHPSTVQRALQGSNLVRPKTAAHVRKVAEELGYNAAANDAARRLVYNRYGKTVLNQAIALYFPSDFALRPYWNRIFQGICEVVNEADYDLITISNDSAKISRHMSNCIVRGAVDGVCLFAANADDASGLLGRLRQEPAFGAKPVVSMIQIVPNTSGVTTDDIQGARLSLGHLLQLGHRHILHMQSDDGLYSVQQRLAGYRMACRDHGVEPETVLRKIIGSWQSDCSGWDNVIAAAMRAHPETTAILAANDFMAIPTVHGLRTMGLSVPEDISIVGYDDSDELLNAERVNILTTVRLPLEDVGREAVRLALDRIKGSVKNDRTTLLPVTLVERGSTAPPRVLA